MLQQQQQQTMQAVRVLCPPSTEVPCALSAIIVLKVAICHQHAASGHTILGHTEIRAQRVSLVLLEATVLTLG
jgi:hypothetical protein